jgi:lysophospholipase L1-like esterase
VFGLVENKYRLIANIKHKRYGGGIPSVTANDNVIFEIELYDDALPYDLTGVTRYTLVTSKKNKTSVIREGTLANGLLKFVLSGSETTESGRVEGTIQLYDAANKRVSSAPLAYEVIRDPSLQGELPTDDKTLVIANESLLTESIEKSEQAMTRVDQLITSTPQPSEVVDARGGEVTLGARLNNLSSSLAQKATKEELQNIGNASPKGVYATLTALQTAYPTGATGIYLVTTDGKWYYWLGSAWTVGGTYQATGLANNTIITKQIKDDAITPYKIRDIEYQLDPFVPVNIFDKDALSVQGEWCNPTTGVFETTAYTGSYFHTDYLPARPNIRYIRKFQLSVVFYDENKVFISGISTPPSMTLNGITGYGVTTPANCAYIVINTQTTSKDTEYLYMAEEDLADPTQYKLDMPKLNINFMQMLKGKQGVCFGDSIFEFGTIPQQIGAFTGADVKNCGFGGTRLVTHSGTGNYNAFCMTKLATAITTGVWTEQDTAATAIGGTYPTILARLKAVLWSEIDFITISFGTNDFTSGYVSLGTTDSTNTNQIYGALNHILSTIMTTYPHLKVYLLTPIFRKTIPNKTGNSDQDSSGAEGNTLYLYDIANAIQTKAKEFHVPCKNLYYESNINRYNQATYLSGDGVHPLPKGYTLLAEKIARFLLSA